jgi:hypothetical protein
MGTPSQSKRPRNGDDRARALLSGMTKFVRSFRAPETWAQLSDQDFQHMTFLACLTYERHPERTLRMFRLFTDMARRFGVLERFHLLGTVTAFIEEGRATAEALMPFILFDESDAIIAAAAREYALLYQSPCELPIAGAALLLARMEEMQALPTRRAPVIAGLVGLGDMRLAPLLTGRAGEFRGPPARRAVSCADGAFASTLHIEFLLDWLEHAANADDAVCAADALATLPQWALDGVVSEVSRVFPSTAAPAGEELEVRSRMSFGEALKNVRPRLASVAMLTEVEGMCHTPEEATRIRRAIERALEAWSTPTAKAA